MEKIRLGKGLDAMFAENTLEDGARIVTLRLSEINPNRNQPRKSFDESALSELAESIAQHGVIQPVLVRPLADGSYQLVAGERRWRAARLAGLTEIPAVVRELSDMDAAEQSLIENLQREDLNAMEEAAGYHTLMTSYGLTQEQVAKAVDKSRPAVANALRLLSLPAPLTELVASGALSAGHARALLSVEDEATQLEIAHAVVNEGMTVRKVEALVKQSRKPPKTPKPAVPRSSFFDEVELALTEHLGRRVRIVTAASGGMMQLEFFNADDLRMLVQEITHLEQE